MRLSSENSDLDWGSDVDVVLLGWADATSPHSVTTQNTNIDIFVAVRTSNHTLCFDDHTIESLSSGSLLLAILHTFQISLL
jgi:hypothetical protein